MISPLASILRRAKRNFDDTVNVLTFPTHERYQGGLADTNAKFYMWQGKGIKDWKSIYAPIPKNHVLLNPEQNEYQIPSDITFDVILSQNKFGQYQVARQLSQYLHVPLISLEHTLPMAQWGEAQVAELKKARGNINIFISEYSRGEWGWEETEAEVIHHGVDSNLFEPGTSERKQHILSVVNDWIQRQWCCNFQGWQRITQGLPVRPIGDTPGLSKPAANTEELVKEYQEAQVFICTATVSPISTALLEAMSCGCACVALATCMVPEIIQNGVNGFISNNENELRQYCIRLLQDKELARKIGANARKTVQEKFGLPTFVNNWNNILYKAANLTYTGQY